MMGIRLDDEKISKKSAIRLAKSKRWCIVCPVSDSPQSTNKQRRLQWKRTEKNGKVNVLLTIVPDDNETYVNLFTTRQAVIDYVKDGIRNQWEDSVDGQGLRKLQEEAEKALNENGMWTDTDGAVYQYDEKGFTA